jgi:hypothetical protein
MTFDELLAHLLPLVGTRIDATVFTHFDGLPELVATMTGTLRAALPLAPDSEAEETEVVNLALSDRDGHDGAEILLDRKMVSGSDIDEDGMISMLLGEVELHLNRAAV